MRRIFRIRFTNGTDTTTNAPGWVQATYNALDLADNAQTTVASIEEIRP